MLQLAERLRNVSEACRRHCVCRSQFYSCVEELKEDLDDWLHYYNYERPHRGLRNMARRPIETIKEWKLVKEETLKLAA